VFPQVRFALGFIPFVHGAILGRFTTDGWEYRASISCNYEKMGQPVTERAV